MDGDDDDFYCNYSALQCRQLFLAALQDGNLLKAKTIYDYKKLDPNVTSRETGETGLHLTARDGYLDLVTFLLEAGADVHIKERRGFKLPIHVAAMSGHLDIVKAFVEAGSGLDDMDKSGRSPLMWATTERNVEVVKFLLQAGASVLTSQGNWHALHAACRAGFTELVEVLIDAAAPVNNPTHYTGRAPCSPLHIAVRHGHLDCVKLLIRAGADVNSVNACRYTPLYEAAYRGYDAIVLELLRHGADPHVANIQKRTPLHEACNQGKIKTAIMLLDIGSKVNDIDFLRDTPLHLMLRANHAYNVTVQLTTILLQYGASPTLLGREDDMALDIARNSGQSYCLELLEMAQELPQLLTQICKVHLRKQLACHWDDIDELPLPIKLKSFLVNEF